MFFLKSLLYIIFFPFIISSVVFLYLYSFILMNLHKFSFIDSVFYVCVSLVSALIYVIADLLFPLDLFYISYPNFLGLLNTFIIKLFSKKSIFEANNLIRITSAVFRKFWYVVFSYHSALNIFKLLLWPMNHLEVCF